jgi:hypothetical protein
MPVLVSVLGVLGGRLAPSHTWSSIMGLYRGLGLGICWREFAAMSEHGEGRCVRSARKFRQLLIPGVSPPKVFTKPCFVSIFHMHVHVTSIIVRAWSFIALSGRASPSPSPGIAYAKLTHSLRTTCTQRSRKARRATAYANAYAHLTCNEKSLTHVS